MSTSAKLASFQAKIAKKATEISYKDTALPTAAVNILDSFLAASKPSTSVSNTYRIDMCPDFTPAFLYLLLNAQNDRATLAAAKNPKVSIYTYVAYQLHIIYVWFLLHDLYVNPLDCKFADTLLDDKFFVEAIEDALEYPVTKPILDVISFWSATCLENQQNIWICPSFANYLHHTHFGRSFPVSILFAAHNATAQNSANAKYADLLYQFATTSLYTIDKFVPGPFDATPAERKRTYTADHYFSLLRPDATHNTRPAPIDSKVNQILLSFLNFDNQKSNKAAAPYASIPIAATVHNERHGFLNPYVMLTCLTRKNTSELQTVYNAVKSVILLQKLSNTNLAACFTSVPSSGSANHGYSNFPSPHWNAWPAATIADPDDKVKKMSDTPLADHQSAMAFKTHHLVAPTGLTFPTLVRRALTMFNLAIGMRSTPNWPSNLTAVRAVLSLTNPDQETTLVPVAATTETGDISTSPSHTYTTVPQADDDTDVNDITDDEADNFPTGPFKQFDEHKDVYPNVKIIMPQGHSVDSAPLVALRGLIIYSEDLTAAAVPQLTSDSEVYDDCAQFLQSAVPFSVTHLATDFQSKFVRPSRATAVTRLAAVSQPVALMIRSHNAVYMPHLERNVFHYGYDRLTYGLTTPTARQRIPLFSQTFLGHTVHTRARTNAAHINAAPTNTPTGHLLVWSPYTFRAPSFEIDNDKDDLNVTAADALRATYFLTNLRTLFGTSQVVVEVKSPIHSLPSV